jgi:glucose/arabinose dehydrogenase/cytochrome c2
MARLICFVGSMLAMAATAHGDAGLRGSRATVDNQQYWVEEIARGLKFPSSIDWLPNGDALITERQGGLRVLRARGLDPKPIEGTPSSYQNLFNGLKEVIVDPDFKMNATVYLLLSEGTYDEHRTAVYRAEYDGDRLVAVKPIFRDHDGYSGVGHSSARMLLLADKTLLIAVPENNYYKHKAQRLDSHIGKMVRINRDGSIPHDNPFVGRAGALPEIWSYGHRVPTGLYQDAPSGNIWEVEPGPRGGDELNLLKPGGNFGWANVTWGFDYSGALAGPLQSSPGVEDPILVWMRTPRSTPAGLTRYHGETYLQWNGDFFVGHLAGARLERLRIEAGRVLFQETMLADLAERIREVKVGPDNHLYLLTDHQTGRVLRLRPGRASESESGRVARKLEQEALPSDALKDVGPGDPIKGQQAFVDHCAACHSVGNIVRGGQIGPDLADVYGRKAGAHSGFTYSSALTQSQQVWDSISLNLFIADPSGYIPGTAMVAPPVTDRNLRRHIVFFLEQL